MRRLRISIDVAARIRRENEDLKVKASERREGDQIRIIHRYINNLPRRMEVSVRICSITLDCTTPAPIKIGNKTIKNFINNTLIRPLPRVNKVDIFIELHSTKNRTQD